MDDSPVWNAECRMHFQGSGFGNSGKYRGSGAQKGRHGDPKKRNKAAPIKM